MEYVIEPRVRMATDGAIADRVGFLGEVAGLPADPFLAAYLDDALAVLIGKMASLKKMRRGLTAQEARELKRLLESVICAQKRLHKRDAAC